MQDFYSYRNQSYPTRIKRAEDTNKSLQQSSPRSKQPGICSFLRRLKLESRHIPQTIGWRDATECFCAPFDCPAGEAYDTQLCFSAKEQRKETTPTDTHHHPDQQGTAQNRVAGLPSALFVSKLGMDPVLAPFSVGMGSFGRSRGSKFRRGTVAGP